MDLIEKIVAGFGGFCIVTTGIMYFWFTTPSTTPIEFVPDTVIRAPTSPPKKGNGGASKSSKKYDDILEKLKSQSRRISRRSIEPVQCEVPTELYERVNKPANMTRELKKARHRVLQTKNGQTRLQVHNIAEDSMLRKFGFEDDDIIELVDGEIIEFREDSTTKLYDLWKKKLNSLRGGGTVSVTISRGNVPMHLEFNLMDR